MTLPPCHASVPARAIFAAACWLAAHAGAAQAQPALPSTDEARASTRTNANTPESTPATCPAAAAPRVDQPTACQPRPQPHADVVPDVASLKTPESPAFMALGVTPSEIQRPSTPTGLKTSLANGFSNGGALPLLQNFALEVTPFWLIPHDLTYEEVTSQRGAATRRAPRRR